MVAEFPAMPLWTDAYLGDCGHLDDADTGRYLMILIHLWRAPKQQFPNDDVWLAHKFRRSVDDVQSQLRPLIKEFCLCTGNWISQDRLSREFAYVLNKSKKQSVRSKARWDKKKGLSHGNAPTPTPTPTPTLRLEPDGSEHESVRVNGSPLLEFSEFWKAYPKHIGKKAAQAKFFAATKSGISPQKINDGAKRYAAWVSYSGTQTQYIKNPSTWLNQGCWDDELTDERRGHSVGQEPMTASDHIMAEYRRKDEKEAALKRQGAG